jgi:hypothetical protein
MFHPMIYWMNWQLGCGYSSTITRSKIKNQKSKVRCFRQGLKYGGLFTRLNQFRPDMIITGDHLNPSHRIK